MADATDLFNELFKNFAHPLRDLPPRPYERALALMHMLVAQCTGPAHIDEEVYRALRREFMANPETARRLPLFVRTSHDGMAFWSYIKGTADQWEPRRQHVREAFQELLGYLETSEHPADTEISEVLGSFDADGVHAVWMKALTRRAADPEGAITAARTLLETVCKHILDDGVEPGTLYGPSDDLPKLYAQASQLLNLAPSQHAEKAFKRILGGCSSVVEGLGSLRNNVGDAHGQGKRPVRPAARHAALAVNLAGSMALFLIETWVARTDKKGILSRPV